MNAPTQFKDRIDFLLQEWVNLNSHSGNLTGLKDQLMRVEDEATTLGLATEWLPSSAEGDAVAALRVSLPSNGGETPLVTLLTHADTVFTKDSPFQLITWAGGRNRAIGPGALCSKAGILTGLLALERMSRIKGRSYRCQLIVIPNAEIGAAGFEATLKSVSEQSAAILGLDPGAPSGSIQPINDDSAVAAKVALKLIEHHEKRKGAPLAGQIAAAMNLLSRPGIPILSGLGPIGSGARTQQETVEMQSIFSRADVIVDLLANLVA